MGASFYLMCSLNYNYAKKRRGGGGEGGGGIDRTDPHHSLNDNRIYFLSSSDSHSIEVH
jgi:hypothetical protein